MFFRHTLSGIFQSSFYRKVYRSVTVHSVIHQHSFPRLLPAAVRRMSATSSRSMAGRFKKRQIFIQILPMRGYYHVRKNHRTHRTDWSYGVSIRHSSSPAMQNEALQAAIMAILHFEIGADEIGCCKTIHPLKFQVPMAFTASSISSAQSQMQDMHNHSQALQKLCILHGRRAGVADRMP